MSRALEEESGHHAGARGGRLLKPGGERLPSPRFRLAHSLALTVNAPHTPLFVCPFPEERTSSPLPVWGARPAAAPALSEFEEKPEHAAINASGRSRGRGRLLAAAAAARGLPAPRQQRHAAADRLQRRRGLRAWAWCVRRRCRRREPLDAPGWLLGAAGSCFSPCGPLGKLVDCLGMRGLARKGPRRMLRRRRGTIRSDAAGLRLIPAPFDLVPLAPPHPSNPLASPPHPHLHPAVAYISGICLLVVVAICLIMVACILRR